MSRQVASAAVTAIGIAATLLAVPKSPAPAPRRIDVLGAMLLALGLVGVLLGLSEGPSWGWSSARVIASLVLTVMFFVAFGIYGGLFAFTLYATAQPAAAGYGWGTR